MKYDILYVVEKILGKYWNHKLNEERGRIMRTTGIIRGIDEVGRIVIPKEYRRMLKVNDKEDSLEISMEGDRIVLRKHMPACTFCGSADGMIEYSGYKICRNCVDNLEQIVGQQVEGE
jgi:transcriptional pleiotropic regulator of transition state genes